MTPMVQKMIIPGTGEQPGHILAQIGAMQQEDVDWKDGRAWSLVYYVNEEHDALLKAASNKLYSSNYLNPYAFKSLLKMEQEVVHMTINMLHGSDTAVGVMSSGGTESILLAMFTYRQRAKKLHPHILQPEVVAPVTIHPAFDKAAVLFGLRLRKTPVDANRCAIPEAMEKAINANTILIVASAPGYPNGALDPIATIAVLAQRHHVPMHVDACIGGFMLPWLEKLGYTIPVWDFRVAGVTSISADVHKFGYGAKGASVLSYCGMDYLQHQFIITTDFPGGIYISSTLMGTRPGGPIAAAWAGMKHLGENGYLAIARQLMDGTKQLKDGLLSIPCIDIVGSPCMNIISYTTKNNKPDIFVIADQLEQKGWLPDREQFPDCIHLTILPTNVNKIGQYLDDLKSAVDYALEHPETSASGNAAIYGLMARITFRGMVEKNVMKIMEDMYGGTLQQHEATAEGQPTAITDSPAWMGRVNRFLSAFKRWKRFFRRKQ